MLGWQYPRCYRHVLVIRPCYVRVMMHGGHEPSGPHVITSVKQSRRQPEEEYDLEQLLYKDQFPFFNVLIICHLVTRSTFILTKPVLSSGRI